MTELPGEPLLRTAMKQRGREFATCIWRSEHEAAVYKLGDGRIAKFVTDRREARISA